MSRRGNWLQTWSGGVFYPLDPRPEEVDINDIAHALSQTCRYGGHCTRFYSVAEHCVWVASVLPPHLQLQGLLHDASEAYLVDVPRPVKPFLPGYFEIEAQLEQVIAQRYGLSWPIPAEVKTADSAMLLLERDQIMATPPMPWNEEGLARIKPFSLPCWDPEEACIEYLDTFVELMAAQECAGHGE